MFSLMFQSVNLFETYKKPMNWFLFDRDLRHKRVNQEIYKKRGT